MENLEKTKISVIIPVFNEAKIIDTVIAGLDTELKKLEIDYELLAVDDGSTDNSQEILRKNSLIKLLSHPYNKGYGASLKTGAKNARYDWLLFFDGDGQHKPEDIKEFLRYADQYDMIAGCRQGYQGPWVRQPGKKLLRWIANYLAEQKIPDLNCGFRLLKKEYFLRYCHLFPNNFSLSTTSTLAFFKEGLSIKYLPITINKRNGQSTVKLSDGLRTIMLIIRLIMLFPPLKIFLPVAFISFTVSVLMIANDLILSNFTLISKSAGFLFITSLLIFLFGLLADQVAAIRRELKR